MASPTLTVIRPPGWVSHGVYTRSVVMRRRINTALMKEGVTLGDPETAYIEPQVTIVRRGWATIEEYAVGGEPLVERFPWTRYLLG